MSGKIIACLLGITLIFWALVCWSGAPSVNKDLDIVISDTLRKFSYVSDKEQYGGDRKISFAKQVKEGKSFKGDCDDFAYTIRDLLLEKGHTVQTVIVRTSKISGSIVHMVVKVDNKYMIDNRYPYVRLWNDGVKGSQYKVLTFGELRELINK
jgi:predicted transglutaminase-like cysteine proteinase